MFKNLGLRNFLDQILEHKLTKTFFDYLTSLIRMITQWYKTLEKLYKWLITF